MDVRNVDFSFFVHWPLTILACRRIRDLDLEVEAVADNIVVQFSRSNGLISRFKLDVTESAMCVVLERREANFNNFSSLETISTIPSLKVSMLHLPR